MVKIRLKRFGRKNRAQWRIVVANIKSPRDGRFIEEIGYYDPLAAQEKIEVRQDRLDYWISRGAQVSVSLKALLRRKVKTAKKSNKS